MRIRLEISLFAVAIVASAAAHAVVFASFTLIRVGSRAVPEHGEMVVVYDPAAREAPPDLNEFDIGEPLAKGYATHDAPGRDEQRAREAPQDQASLSLDPVGLSRVVDVPSNPGDEAERAAPNELAPPALAAGALPPMQVEAILPPAVNEQLRQDRLEAVSPTVSPPAEPVVAAPVPTEAVLAPLPPPVPVAPVPVAPAPVVPAPPAVAAAAGSGADPAPKSESESDAFSVLGSAQFRAGRVSVQSGRQVKTRRPRVGLAGMVELAHRGRAEVELKVRVDPTGKVTNVDIARSSGSNDIDQPCRVAMYDWWFEPKKDAAGRPVSDKFRFTISFR